VGRGAPRIELFPRKQAQRLTLGDMLAGFDGSVTSSDDSPQQQAAEVGVKS
jgi:hypothetical protein